MVLEQGEGITQPQPITKTQFLPRSHLQRACRTGLWPAGGSKCTAEPRVSSPTKELIAPATSGIYFLRFENNQKFIKLKTSRRFLHLRRGSTLWFLAYFHLLLKYELDFRQTVSGTEARGVWPDSVPSPRPPIGFGSLALSPHPSLLSFFCHISVLLCGLDCFLHPTFLSPSPLPDFSFPFLHSSSLLLPLLPLLPPRTWRSEQGFVVGVLGTANACCPSTCGVMAVFANEASQGGGAQTWP